MNIPATFIQPLHCHPLCTNPSSSVHFLYMLYIYFYYLFIIINFTFFLFLGIYLFAFFYVAIENMQINRDHVYDICVFDNRILFLSAI